MDQSFRIAIIQHAPQFLNIEGSLEKAASLIQESAKRGAQMIVFPETWLPGYPVWLDYAPKAGLWDYPPAKALYRILAENALTIPGTNLSKLLSIAKKSVVYIVMGCHEKIGGTLYNTMILADKNGKDYVIHRKLMPTYTERLIWGQGDGSTLSVLVTEYGHIGGLICWEHWMPLARAAMHAKREIVHVAQWPYVKEMHQIASRHYAFEGQCFVAAAGCVLSRGQVLEGLRSLAQPEEQALEMLEQIPGSSEDLLLKGGSAVIGPDGNFLCEPLYDKSDILYADLDLAKIQESNLVIDTDGHYSRPDIFKLQVNTNPQSNVSFEDDVS